jgi:co-chaperonin GroES (HSP10)
MFPDLSKAFGRDFLVGYFLPATMFVISQIAAGLMLYTDAERLFLGSDVPEVLRDLVAPRRAINQTTAVDPLDGRLVVRLDQSTAPASTGTAASNVATGKPLAGGEVLAISDNVVLDSGERAVRYVARGDTVYFSLDSAAVLRRGHDVFCLIKESDVAARVGNQPRKSPLPPSFTQLCSAKAIVALTVASWMLGILFMATNREFYRFLEGYGPVNPLRLAGFIEGRRYRRLSRRRDQLKAKRPNLSVREKKRLADVAYCLVQNFPRERSLMPTRFGNIIRGFEEYSLIMYGFDAIPGFERLQVVASKEARDAIVTQKTQVDFWLNLWICGIVVVCECFVIAWMKTGYAWILPFVALCGYFVVINRAKAAAREWGEAVKAAVDTSLPLLPQKLAFATPADNEAERKMWEHYSQAIIFRLPERLPKLAAPQGGGPAPGGAPPVEGDAHGAGNDENAAGGEAEEPDA